MSFRVTAVSAKTHGDYDRNLFFLILDRNYIFTVVNLSLCLSTCATFSVMISLISFLGIE